MREAILINIVGVVFIPHVHLDLMNLQYAYSKLIKCIDSTGVVV